LAIAPNGTIYASDPDWISSKGQVWYIDRQGNGRVVAADMGTTNGIEVSPDGKWLYVNESVQRKIWKFEIQADGSLGAQQLVKEFPDHGFDGMRCDADGNLYVTRYGKGTVVVLRPSGEILREIDVLGTRPSNLCFGGIDGRTVTVTEVEHGRLVRFRTEIPGRSHRLFPQAWIDEACRWIERDWGGNSSQRHHGSRLDRATRLYPRRLEKVSWADARSIIDTTDLDRGEADGR
jgi:sugar lactone lactonase YvrE